MSGTRLNGLRYYPDSKPGITRRRKGKGFAYVGPGGDPITDRGERARIMALGIPPAYRDVWISPHPNGHLSATGVDARGRKQYRYHPKWAEARSLTKFAALADFGAALPAIRARVRRDLAGRPGDEACALAAAVALIDRLSLRIGHPEYARDNGSYGALTLQRRHVRLTHGRLVISFTAKGGRRVRRQLADKRLQQVLSRIRDLPGADLISWTDADGASRCVSSGALNDYLGKTGRTGPTGLDHAFTAKTFRTWAGTVAAFDVALHAERPTITAMATAAADRLHNTAAIARKSYIHPAVIGLTAASRPLPDPVQLTGLTVTERRLLAFLRHLET